MLLDDAQMPNSLRDVGVTFGATLIFFLLHIPIAIISREFVEFSTFYAIAVFLIGCWAAMGQKSLFVICIVSYIVGGEVLWRMTGAKVYWEFGKYATAGILILAIFIIKKGRVQKSVNQLLLYFLFLIPAIFLARFESLTQWRTDISFNMSGPLAILVCGLFFSGVTIKKTDLQRMFIFLIAPIVSIAYIALVGIKEAVYIQWSTASVPAASGGFGPNQVSIILGFGVFLCTVLFFLLREKSGFKNIFILLWIWFLTQAILTFSRGGPLQAALAVSLFLIFLIKSYKKEYFIQAILIAVVFIFISGNFIIPAIDKYTKGALRERYSEFETVFGRVEVPETTGRYDVFLSDINIFKKRPFGVGAGNSPRIHKELLGRPIAAHTEWSRLVAEHGIFGLFSAVFILLWIFKRYKSFEGPLSKAMASSFILFLIVYFSHAAFRTTIPAFIIAFLSVDFEENQLYKDQVYSD